MKQLVKRIPKKHRIFIASVSCFIAVLTIIPSQDATASKATNVSALEIGKRYDLAVKIEESQQAISTSSVTPVVNKKTLTVKNGDSLATLFKRAGYSAQTLHKLVNADKQAKTLTKIHPGDKLNFISDEANELQTLEYLLTPSKKLVIAKQKNNRFKSHIEEKEVQKRNQFATAKIKSNFWNAGVDAGLSDAQIMNLANIFGWDVDFALDIRKGDELAVIYEKKFIDGEYIGDGEIVVAQFTNQGEEYNAIRYADGKYYTPEGRSMKKTFLRAPVNFKYISSSFNPRRKHPVTGRISAHRGIDYAARTGTPVVASGAGKVVKAGYNRLNGNYIFIKHGEKYLTKYLHLSKKLVKKNQTVKQGQLIGKVGATGRVTGAHLHYEFLVNGVHRNPKTITNKLPKAKSISKKELAKFNVIKDNMLQALNTEKRVLLAMQN